MAGNKRSASHGSASKKLERMLSGGASGAVGRQSVFKSAASSQIVGSGRKPLSNSYDFGVGGSASASTTVPGHSPGVDSWNAPGASFSFSYDGVSAEMNTTGIASMCATMGTTGRHSIGN